MVPRPKDLATLTAGILWDRLSEAAGLDVDLLRFEELDASFQERVLAEGLKIGGP